MRFCMVVGKNDGFKSQILQSEQFLVLKAFIFGYCRPMINKPFLLRGLLIRGLGYWDP